MRGMSRRLVCMGCWMPEGWYEWEVGACGRLV